MTESDDGSGEWRIRQVTAAKHLLVAGPLHVEFPNPHEQVQGGHYLHMKRLSES